MTPKRAVNVVKDIQSKAKGAIENNPNTKINDLKLGEQVVPIGNATNMKITEPVKVKYENQWEKFL